MFGRILTFVLICLLVAAGAAFIAGPWLHPGADEKLPPCPYFQSQDLSKLPPEVVTASGAYEAIRETLSRDSLEGVAQQAATIVRVFQGLDARVVSTAKRLADAPDVESARRAFLRLHRAMDRHSQRGPAPSLDQ
jgi:hypothetical protein